MNYGALGSNYFIQNKLPIFNIFIYMCRPRLLTALIINLHISLGVPNWNFRGSVLGNFFVTATLKTISMGIKISRRKQNNSGGENGLIYAGPQNCFKICFYARLFSSHLHRRNINFSRMLETWKIINYMLLKNLTR